MKFVKPTKRMTLRELLTHTEKCSRDLIDHLHSNILPHISDFRDLNRPVRKRSHFPTLLAVQNSLKKLEEANDEAVALSEYLLEQLQSIRDSAVRELSNRL